MRLLIAREAVDAHLTAAGDLANPKADFRQKAKAAAGASGFYAKWLPQLVFGEGQLPTSYREFGRLATHLRFVERCARKLARNTFYGMARWQAELEQKQGFLGRIVDIGAELFAMSAACVRAEAQRVADPAQGQRAYELADAFCRQATLRGGRLARRVMGQHRQHRYRTGKQRPRGPLYLAGGRDPGPIRGHRTVDRFLGAGRVYPGQRGAPDSGGTAELKRELLRRRSG